MKNDYLFQTPVGKFLFEDVEWNEITTVRPVSELPIRGEREIENIATYTAKALERLFAEKVPYSMKLNTAFNATSAEDFYYCLSVCGIEFSCSNKPLIVPLFDYDGLTKEEFERKEKLEQQYRDGLIPPEITYEFPITIALNGKSVPFLIRFRDTEWFETDTFTVELAEGDAAPEGWEKNAYGEYEFPEDDLWEIESLSAVFPAYDKECSPCKMWQRLGEKQPVKGHVFTDPPFQVEQILRYM